MPTDDRPGTPHGVFGRMLGFYRERAGMTQTDLAPRVFCSHDVISKIEKGTRGPAKELPGLLDAVPELGTNGALTELWESLREASRNRAYPGWFTWPDKEAVARELRWYEPMLIPGLVQTEEYARAVLRGTQQDASDESIEQQVALRMGRQRVLDRTDPPYLRIVIDEGVLHRTIGNPQIMHTQLLELAESAGRPRVTVQVIPLAAGERTGLNGAFIVAEQEDGDRVLYLETGVIDQLVEELSTIRQAERNFGNLQGEALPRAASRDLILKVAEERWT